MATTPHIPESLADRFVTAFDEFLAAVRAAVNFAVLRPELSNTQAFLAWQMKVLPRLEEQYVAVLRAKALFQIGEERTLVSMAQDKRGLAKDLDGFPLDFAGPDRVSRLDALETAVVVAAYQLCKAAGIP